MDTDHGHEMPMSDHDMMMQNMQMQMSFYWGKDATVLFSGWPKHSVGMYILSILFVFFLAMAAELLSNKPTIKRGMNPVVGALTMASIYVFRISFIYLVMLAVMSFNLGIFIAAVAGHTLGFFISKSRSLAMADRNQNGGSSITDKV